MNGATNDNAKINLSSLDQPESLTEIGTIGVLDPNNLTLLDKLEALFSIAEEAIESESTNDDGLDSLDSDPVATFASRDAPSFSNMSKSRMEIMLRQKWVELNHAETVLAANLERYRQMLVIGIVSKSKALAITESITPGFIVTLPLSLNQMNLLLQAMKDKVMSFGIQPPSNWDVDFVTFKPSDNDFEEE